LTIEDQPDYNCDELKNSHYSLFNVIEAIISPGDQPLLRDNGKYKAMIQRAKELRFDFKTALEHNRDFDELVSFVRNWDDLVAS
jgi:hypothetical protein